MSCYQYNSNCRYNNYGKSSNSFQGNEFSPNRYSGNMGGNNQPNNSGYNNFSGSYGSGMNASNRSGRFLHDELPMKLSDSLALRKSPERKTPCKSMMQIEENCNAFLKLLVDVESEAEKQKIQNFAKVNDFNIDDVFLFFETDNTQNDILSPQDLKEGFNKMGMELSEGDIKFLLNKFDLMGDGGISFANLFDMLVPFDKKNRDLVEARPTTGNMSEQVAGGLKNYIDFVFDSEKKLDELRTKALENKKFDPAKFFQEQMDINGTGCITIQEFEKFLEGRGIIKNQREADLVFIRLDRNRDGKVAVDEFVDEFTPLENKLGS